MWYKGTYFVAGAPTEGQIDWWRVTWERDREIHKVCLVIVSLIWSACWSIAYLWFI